MDDKRQSDFRRKLGIACDGKLPVHIRAFAMAELVFQPVSLLSVVAAIILPVLRCADIWTPPATVSRWGVPILVAAAVGYLTNWIAITMLFEPYEKTWRHWIPWATFGLWRQGLLPKNKARIATALANQVSTKLIRPEKLADDLCAMVGVALQDPDTLHAVQTLLQEQVAAHDTEIVDFLVPRIEGALIREIDRLVTPDHVRTFWDIEIMPRLESEENREKIARIVLNAIRKRSPEIAAKARPLIVSSIRRWFENSWLASIPFVGNDACEKIADSLANWFLDEKTIEDGMRYWIKRPETAAAIRDELLGFVESFRAWFASPEGAERIGGFALDIRARFKEYLRDYLHSNLASAASQLLRSETTWEWVSKAIPAMRPGVERMIRDVGTKAIIEKLDVEGRVKSAVDGMDMSEFHGMLNEIMAEHLGAIQVLGYVLGAITGITLVLK